MSDAPAGQNAEAPEDAGYCVTPAVVSCRPAGPGELVAPCVLCEEPTDYAADTSGLPVCARCEWQQAQRGACSG